MSKIVIIPELPRNLIIELFEMCRNFGQKYEDKLEGKLVFDKRDVAKMSQDEWLSQWLKIQKIVTDEASRKKGGNGIIKHAGYTWELVDFWVGYRITRNEMGCDITTGHYDVSNSEFFETYDRIVETNKRTRSQSSHWNWVSDFINGRIVVDTTVRNFNSEYDVKFTLKKLD